MENVIYPKVILLLYCPVKDGHLQREPKGIQHPNPTDGCEEQYWQPKGRLQSWSIPKYFIAEPRISCYLITSKGKGWAKHGYSWNLKCAGKQRGWVAAPGRRKGCWWCLEFAYEQRDREKAREGMWIHLTDKETYNSQCKSRRWQLRWEFLLPLPPSFMILHHDQYFRLPLHQQCLKTSSCSKENHLYSRHTQGHSDLNSREQRQAIVMVSFIQELLESCGIFHGFSSQRWFHFTKCKITQTAVLMTSVSIRTKPPVAVSFCQRNKSSSAAHFRTQFMLQLTPFCTLRAKPHSQPCYSKSLSGPDLPTPSFLAGRVSGSLPGQVCGCKSPKEPELIVSSPGLTEMSGWKSSASAPHQSPAVFT